MVLFDQRGGGRATPAMTCDDSAPAPAPDAPLDIGMVGGIMQRLLVECRDRWRARGVDLAAYNTVESAADVNDLRLALGYPKITLIGGSYGSHLALQFMRQFPDAVDRAVIFGVEGPDHTWDDPGGALHTLERIAAATEQSPEFRGRIPEGGLIKDPRGRHRAPRCPTATRDRRHRRHYPERPAGRDARPPDGPC